MSSLVYMQSYSTYVKTVNWTLLLLQFLQWSDAYARVQMVIFHIR